MDTKELASGGITRIKERMDELVTKAAMFDWLMTQMSGHSLHMDGKQWWSLPCSTLNKYPCQRPQEAVEQAYAQYLTWVSEALERAQESPAEPPFKDGELGPLVD